MDAGPKVQQNSNTTANATAFVVFRLHICRIVDGEGDLPAMPLSVEKLPATLEIVYDGIGGETVLVRR